MQEEIFFCVRIFITSNQHKTRCGNGRMGFVPRIVVVPLNRIVNNLHGDVLNLELGMVKYLLLLVCELYIHTGAEGLYKCKSMIEFETIGFRCQSSDDRTYRQTNRTLQL